MFRIRDVLGPSTPQVTAVIVGAAEVADEGFDPQRIIAERSLGTIVGFEPDRQACDALNAKGGAHRFFPYFVGDGSERTFYRTAWPVASSLYKPNEPLLRKFQGLVEWTREEEQKVVRTVRLDDIPEVKDADYLMIDVQGAELDVLRGAAATLSHVVLAQIEVEFAPLYEDQPLFGDVDRHLSASGFRLHKMPAMMGPPFRPLLRKDGKFWPISQVLWADAIYARDFMRLEDLPPRKLLALATLIHELYESVDFAAVVLRAHDKKTGSQFWRRYVTAVVGQPPPDDFED